MTRNHFLRSLLAPAPWLLSSCGSPEASSGGKDEHKAYLDRVSQYQPSLDTSPDKGPITRFNLWLWRFNFSFGYLFVRHATESKGRFVMLNSHDRIKRQARIAEPKGGWDSFWKTLDKMKAYDLPDESELKTHSNWTDAMMIYVDGTRAGARRPCHYYDPWTVGDKPHQAVVDLLAYVHLHMPANVADSLPDALMARTP